MPLDRRGSTKSHEFSTDNIPKLVDPTSKQFQATFKEWGSFHREVFGDKQADPDLWKFDAFKQNYLSAPQRQQIFARSLISRLLSYQESGFIVNGDPLWDHQKALLTEEVPVLVSRRNSGGFRNTSILMHQAPGVGKTRLGGVLVGAHSDSLIREETDEGLLSLIRRRAIIAQQVATKLAIFDSVRELTSAPRAVKIQHRYIQNILWPVSKTGISLDAWMQLHSCTTSEKAAEEGFRSLLQNHGILDQFMAMPNAEELMEQVVSMLTGTGDVIRAPLSKISGAEHQYLNLGKRPKKDMGGRDLLFAVDQQLFDAGKVFVQSGLDFGSKQERPTNDTRIAVMAATSLTQESSRAAISGFLSNVGILLMDEAMNRSGGEHQRLVTKYSHDEKHPPIAVVSTAHDPKKNGGLGYDVKLSHFEAEMGVNTEPVILEPMRMKVVPHRGQILYRSGTFEAADQLLRAYDESLPLLKASGQEQPNFGHHIVAVDRNIVPYMMILMQQRHLHTGVQCVSYEDNTDEQFAATIQAAMNNPNAAPICLVTAPGSILDSYDFVELAGLYVGADLNTENLRRIIGRLLHTRKKNGGTVMVQRFAKSAPVSQVPWGVYTPDLSIDPQSQSQKFVDGQYFLGAKAVAREQDVLKAGKFRSREHLTNVSSRVFDELTPSETGHYPPTINAQRDIRASFGVQFPPIARKKSVLSEDYMREFAELNGVTYEDLAKEMNETVKKLSDLERLRSALARVRCKAIPQFGNRPWKEYAGKSQGRNRSPSYKGNGHSLTPAIPMGKRERKTGVDGPRAPDHDNRLRLMERRREQGLDIFGAEDYLLKPESADEATSA